MGHRPLTSGSAPDPLAGPFLTVCEQLEAAGEPYLAGRLELWDCPDIERARAAGDDRYYAHVDHHGDNVICVAPALGEMPARNQFGVLWHEVGHLLDDRYTIRPGRRELAEAARVYAAEPERVQAEAAANTAVRQLCGVVITYGPDRVQRAD